MQRMVKAWKQTALNAIDDVFSGAHDKDKKGQEQLVEDLYQEIGRLQAQLSWLKKSMNVSLDEKRSMIEAMANISIREHVYAVRAVDFELLLQGLAIFRRTRTVDGVT